MSAICRRPYRFPPESAGVRAMALGIAADLDYLALRGARPDQINQVARRAEALAEKLTDEPTRGNES